MNKFNLKDFTGGWFIGNFNPSLFQSSDFEIAIKRYNAGDSEPSHYHKIATEITAIISGKVRMNENIYESNDIILINPNESTNFIAIENTTTCVVKIPSIPNDKFLND
jgi:quercetin dioxygenase-like cupin family protein